MPTNHVPVPDGYRLIFRRYRHDPRTRELLDARRFGIRAWPMIVKIDD